MPQRRVFRPVPANQLLILLNVILHRPQLVLLHAAIAGDQIALRVALAAGKAEQHERSQSRPRRFRAVQSRFMREILQENGLMRLRDVTSQTRQVRPEFGLPQGVQ